MTRKILVVDDETQIVTVLKAYLEKAEFQVITAYDGKTALAKFQHEKPDFVILDLNLPYIDGLELCKLIRRESDVPILMLTARVEETDRLIGLELGADDYVIKPFSPREVTARVKTILRRANSEPTRTGLINVGELSIDPEQHTVEVAGRFVAFTPTEFEILVVLASQPKRVLTRLQIMEQSQGNAFAGYERTIDAHIKNIRLKLEKNPRKPDYIKTVFGIGYKLDTGKDAE
ncbi:MAG: response regulator transcription factor [Flexilinea sp.]